MIEVSPAWSRPVPAADRELTYAETADLDRLRAVLASACDRTDPRAISWLWDSMVAGHGGPAPAGFVEAVATALGDLLAVHVAGVRWRVWPGPAGPTLGVVSHLRPQAPVVPFLDAQDRWDARARDWMAEYLSRAAAHLSGATVPQPRRGPDDEAAFATAAPPVDAADDEAAPPYEPMTAVPTRSTPTLPTRIAAPVADVPPIALAEPTLPADLMTPSAFEPADEQFVAPAAAPLPVTLLTRATAPEAAPPQSTTAAPDAAPPAEAPGLFGAGFSGPVFLPGPEEPLAAAPLPTRVPVATAPVDVPAPVARAAVLPVGAPWAAAPIDASGDSELATAADAPAEAAPAPGTPAEDFALDALDHAMVLLRDTGAFDREVFVLLLDAQGGRRTESCPGDPGEARFRARELVRSSGAARAAITFIERDPADLPGPRQAFPAVVVDAWDAGTGGVRVGRRFVDDVLGTGPLGPPLVVGHIARLL
ncbi:MAG: hypothetical protein BGO37_14640 [Cellulomonas sp. 73-92]|uniref:hypothetical protein n=1 Tax=Cellulomonas sp. 73-92 TaxID=1895740 RepID=UPI000929D581|nr:hypothetical protein [Cellulomonas sp. 73-92]OJV80790.1 MAG: hypothetical protein BGO37_14640 [Cellulomonas sp. 73-92]